ncbi:DNA glycosylase, partial [Gaertneriomyces semiglobifer]
CPAHQAMSHPVSYHQFSEVEKSILHSSLLRWYDSSQRSMPWRKPPLPIWISEIMLQQTQVSTVIPYYNTWMSKWPTVWDLASADMEDINKVWSGLGYYNRARRLHEAAKLIVNDYDGLLPNDEEEMERVVPGVGPYTARAIASIAYGIPTGVVDGNVIRVLSRLRAFGADPKAKSSVEWYWTMVARVVHHERPGDWNQALMELGATVCTVVPKCGECPVKEVCLGYQEGIEAPKVPPPIEDACTLCSPDIEDCKRGPTRYPGKTKKKAPKEEDCLVWIIERKLPSSEESVFCVMQNPAKGLLANLWDFPHQPESVTGDLSKKEPTYEERKRVADRWIKERFGSSVEVRDRRDLGTVMHLFSHIRRTMFVEYVEIQGNADPNAGRRPIRWLTGNALLSESAVPTTLKKALALLHNTDESKKTGKRKAGGHASKPRKSKKATSDRKQPTISGFFIAKNRS